MKQHVHDEIKNHKTDQDPPEYMNCPFNTEEFEEALKTLKDKESPGPDKITNKMLEHHGTKAKSKLLGIFNNSWKTGHVPQSWREADIVPIHKKGKDWGIQTAIVLSSPPVVWANSWKNKSTLAWYGTWRITSSLQSRQAFGRTILLKTW